MHGMHHWNTRGSLRLLLLLLLIAIGAADAADVTAVVSLGVDWPSFLRRHDPVWEWSPTGVERPPNKFYDALFGGNAMLGFMLWQVIDNEPFTFIFRSAASSVRLIFSICLRLTESLIGNDR
eukprot:SAG11_NODE_4484_length_1878_cov_7.328274_3_plen_122_part_00